ncbi:MAG: hypothetical protein OXG69_00940, partial [bacterium]|nr:hypothetical protein [bacterium]
MRRETAVAAALTPAVESVPPSSGTAADALAEVESPRPAVERLTLQEYETSEPLPLTGAQARALNGAGGGAYLSVEPAETSGRWH